MAEDETVVWHHRSTDMSQIKLRDIVADEEYWRAAVHGLAESDTT